MYPNGADEKEYIGIYLRVANAEKTTFKVHYQFGLMNRNHHKIEYLYDVDKRNGHELDSGLGYPKFLSHAKLFDASKNFVVDGKLTIACKVS